MLENHKNRISAQAFIEQVQNWELTLGREQKKLRSLRNKLHSKMLRNEIEIIITEIEGELIRYRKLKDPTRMHSNNYDVIQEYNDNSKRFMDIMESVGNFADKVEAHQEDDLPPPDAPNKHDGSRQASRQNYQDQTFTYSISKQPKYETGMNTANKGSSKVSKKSSSKLGEEKEKMRNKTAISTPSSSIALKEKSQQARSRVIQMTQHNASNNSLGGNEIDSWQIRYQLNEIKSMMSQIKNEIKYHNHEDIEVELSKLQHQNKKMSLEMKGLKEDSQYITSRIQKLKQELATEKQIQAQMIEEFENPGRVAQSRKTKTKSASESVENSRVRNNISHSIHEEVSEWVKVRI